MPQSTELHFSLEIFSEQISKAYGQAVSHTLVHSSPPTRPKTASAGPGAVVISRKIPFQSLNAGNAVVGRPECATSIRVDPVMDAASISKLLCDLSKESQNVHQLEGFINENFFCATKSSSKDGVRLEKIGVRENAPGALTDVFTVKNKKKERKIRFVGEEGHIKHALTFVNTCIGYDFYYSFDREFKSVVLCRVVPKLLATDTTTKRDRLWVYETLIVFNSLKYCVAECVPFPGLSAKDVAPGDIRIKASMAIQKRAIDRSKEEERPEVIRYLRSTHALRMYFPRGSGGKLQNKSSIVYVKDFLETLARLHYTYNALLAISAAMAHELFNGSPTGVPSKSARSGQTNTTLDTDIIKIRNSAREAAIERDGVDVEYCKDIEKIHDCIAVLAGYVSEQYKQIIPQETAETSLQLDILKLADSNAGQWDVQKLRDNYGYLLVRNLLKYLPVVTQNMQHSANRNSLSPLEINLHQVEPYTGVTDYGDAWTLKIYYSAYHRQFLNLAPWVSADGKTPPAWMKKYTCRRVLPKFNSSKIGEESIFDKVVPTRLNYDQKIEVTVHTFLSGVDGARVKNDKKKALPKRPAA